MSGRPRPNRVTTYDGLLATADGDAFARWELDPAEPVVGWVLGAATGFARTGQSGRPTLAVVGPPDAAAVLVAAVVAEGVRPGGLTLPRGTVEHLEPLVAPLQLRGGADWDWMATTEPPPAVPGEDAVVALGPRDSSEVAALLEAASPRAGTVPGAPGVVAWVGVRDDGRLVACGAHTEHVAGVPHLAGIATLPGRRGRGLGTAVTAALTRRLLGSGSPVVTLGLYADNDAARRIYRRLGFAEEHLWSSRLLVG